MKKLSILFIAILCILLLASCNFNTPEKSTKDEASSFQAIEVWDSYSDSGDAHIDAFPSITFTRNNGVVYAGNDKIIGGGGYNCLSCYACDLTGDGYPELCFCMSLGSGIIDERIVILDYQNNKTLFELSDRGYHDYYLCLKDNILSVNETMYNMSKEITRTGKITSIDSTIQVAWDN